MKKKKKKKKEIIVAKLRECWLVLGGGESGGPPTPATSSAREIALGFGNRLRVPLPAHPCRPGSGRKLGRGQRVPHLPPARPRPVPGSSFLPLKVQGDKCPPRLRAGSNIAISESQPSIRR